MSLILFFAVVTFVSSQRLFSISQYCSTTAQSYQCSGLGSPAFVAPPSPESVLNLCTLGTSACAGGATIRTKFFYRTPTGVLPYLEEQIYLPTDTNCTTMLTKINLTCSGCTPTDSGFTSALFVDCNAPPSSTCPPFALPTPVPTSSTPTVAPTRAPTPAATRLFQFKQFCTAAGLSSACSGAVIPTLTTNPVPESVLNQCTLGTNACPAGTSVRAEFFFRSPPGVLPYLEERIFNSNDTTCSTMIASVNITCSVCTTLDPSTSLTLDCFAVNENPCSAGQVNFQFAAIALLLLFTYLFQ